jgi:lysophospholipase L1-like esterase
MPISAKFLPRLTVCLFAVASGLLVYSPSVVVGEADKPQVENPSARWESAIQNFEEQDKAAPPKKNHVVFVGSSSIRLWKLDKSFPDLQPINRGFGGSEIADSVHFADRIILKHQPRVVVLYAGDNDLARGKTPGRVAADFELFVSKIHRSQPGTKIVFIAVKPSIARWKLIDEVRAANAAVAEICGKNELLEFVDIDAPMLGDDGKPRPELFLQDGLHITDAAYEIWSKLVRPHIVPRD